MTATIGFIGLGQMGAAMVERLQEKDYALVLLANRSRGAIDAAIARGAEEAASARELAAKSDIVMLCMDTSASVESRMYGDDGVIAGLAPGKVVIDFGTSLPESTRALGAAVAAAGAGLLDAPLGRTPAHAREGKLNIMAAGDPATFEQVEDTLAVLGENVFHLGELGSGHTIKLINNFFGMTLANAMAEAFATAEAAGVDPGKLYEVMAAGPLHCGMMDFVAAYALREDPDQLEFSVRNARKDVTYYARMADDLGAASIMSTSAKQALSLAANSGFGDKNMSVMVDFYRRFNGREA